jgi:hypothetical protein
MRSGMLAIFFIAAFVISAAYEAGGSSEIQFAQTGPSTKAPPAYKAGGKCPEGQVKSGDGPRHACVAVNPTTVTAPKTPLSPPVLAVESAKSATVTAPKAPPAYKAGGKCPEGQVKSGDGPRHACVPAN